MARLPTAASLLVFIVWAVGGAVGHTPCSEAEHRSMQERFTACRGRHRDGGDSCHILNQVLRGCGKVWQECHTPQEIRTLESMHVEVMVAQWAGDKGLDDCPLYKQYR